MGSQVALSRRPWLVLFATLSIILFLAPVDAGFKKAPQRRLQQAGRGTNNSDVVGLSAAEQSSLLLLVQDASARRLIEQLLSTVGVGRGVGRGWSGRLSGLSST